MKRHQFGLHWSGICNNSDNCFIFSEIKQNLDSVISFVDSNPQYNKYYLILMKMTQDVLKEQYKDTETKISSYFKTVSVILII
jgi:hypothetical protein